MDIFISKINYVLYFVLFTLGFYAMMAKNNFFKKIIGMSIFQASVILFYVSMGYKKGANIPIVPIPQYKSNTVSVPVKPAYFSAILYNTSV